MKSHRAFPPGQGNLKIPTSSRPAARAGLALYAPCRPKGRLARWVAWRAVDVFGAGAVPGRPVSWTPPMEAETWQALRSEWTAALGPFNGLAVHERIQTSRSGFAALLLSDGRPIGFVKVRDGDDSPLRNEFEAMTLMHAASPESFEIPRPLGLATLGGWSYLLTSALRPDPHRMPVDPPVGNVVAEVRAGLASLPRAPGIPDHWEPMHGDFTPWNLRQRTDGTLFLIDWEDAGWAPPGADDMYYWVVCSALDVATEMPVVNEEVRGFWWQHLSGPDRDAQTADSDFRLRTKMLSVLSALGQSGR